MHYRRFLRFNSNGQYLMTSTSNDNQDDTQHHVYDLLGNELEAIQLSEEDWTDNSPPTQLNNQLPGFQGEFRSLSFDGQLFLTYSQEWIERRLIQEGLLGEDRTASVCPRVARRFLISNQLTLRWSGLNRGYR